MKDESAPSDAKGLLGDAANRAARLSSSLAAHGEGLPPDGLAALARVSGAVERFRAVLDDALRRGNGENRP